MQSREGGSRRGGSAMSLIVGESSRGSSSAAAPSTTTSSAPFRRSQAFQDDDDEDYDEGYDRKATNGHSNGRHPRRAHDGSSSSSRDEVLTGYSRERGAERAGQSSSSSRRAEPKVIAKQADLNWMEERKRRLGLTKYRQELGSLVSMKTPSKESNGTEIGEGAGQGQGTASERIGEETQLSGLQHVKQNGAARSREEEEMAEIAMLQAAARQAQEEGSEAKLESGSPMRLDDDADDEAARHALLTGQGLGSNGRLQEDRIIPISEEEALKRDTDSRPEAPTLSDYAKMPVEDFGAALLRGMGWKEGMGAGKSRQGPISAPEVTKRAALLGLGAKERKLNEDTTSRNKYARQERPERRYVPVTHRDRTRRSRSPVERRERSRSPQRGIAYKERDIRHTDSRSDSYDRRSRDIHGDSTRQHDRDSRSYRDRDRDRNRDEYRRL